MGINTNYLGHVEIVPALNKAEYDYLTAFSQSRRTARPGGPYAVTPKDPDTGRTAADVDRYNSIWDGQPGYWCQWKPCPHGCCLNWDGREKFYAGPAWLRYLIDHFLCEGALAQSSGDAQFAGFTFDHQVNGVLVGEQQDLRKMFVLWVEDCEVTESVLRPSDPDYGQPGYRGLDDRPWLPDEPREHWDNDLQAWVPVPSRPPVEARKMRAGDKRVGTTVEPRERRTGGTEVARPAGQLDRRGGAG
jgi:hypothetical protein